MSGLGKEEETQYYPKIIDMYSHIKVMNKRVSIAQKIHVQC